MRIAHIVDVALLVAAVVEKSLACVLYAEENKFVCQGAMFGGFIPKSIWSFDVVVAHEPFTACSKLEKRSNASMILVQRGECAFSHKVMNVDDANGGIMVMINSDDTVFSMQTLEWIDTNVIAVTVSASDGEKLKELLPSSVKLASTESILDQCIARIRKLLEINVPRLAIETFYDCHQHHSHTPESTSFYLSSAQLFSQSNYKSWDAFQRITLLSSISALGYTNTSEAHILAAESLQVAGLFSDSIVHYGLVHPTTVKAQCGMLLSYFLTGNYDAASKLYNSCPASHWNSIPSIYRIAAENLQGIMKHNVAFYLKPGNYCSIDDTEHTYQFTTASAKYVFESFTQMGVYLDELGAFDSSLVHFEHALRMCGQITSLHIRLALAIPTVFPNSLAMEKFIAQLIRKVQDLRWNDSMNPSTISNIRPENAAHLKWTITPPTMLLGYQGYRVDTLQTEIVKMYQRMYSIPRLLPPRLTELQHTKKRIGFISSWFRTHSVGKLLLSILEHLDRDRFEVIVLAASHFLPISLSDKITKQFQATADAFVVLPKNMNEALDLIATQDIDVLVFPELGMDSWMVFLSYHRLARVQCMFWGHPITSGSSSIDYFISSDYFFGDKTSLDDHYTEQVVLFNSLSTYFTRPQISSLSPNRGRFHIPEAAHVYICPQTLMKIHVQFDEVLYEILERDPKAYIILLYSKSQTLWRHRLRDRFESNTARQHRIIFLETLPYEHFMQLLSIADVMLDPFPFGGGVTTLDALTLGLPVVTLPSKQTVVELAAGFYRYMNMTDCIAHSQEDYITKAISIGTNPTYRSALTKAIQSGHGVIYDDFATSKEWNLFFSHV